MDNFEVTPSGLIVPRIKPIVLGPMHLTYVGLETYWHDLEKEVRGYFEKLLKSDLKDRISMMAGSLSNYASKSVQDLLWGKTAYAGEVTIYCGLWTAALDDTFTGATASEANYTSYARLSLTNNTTNFAAGTGTTIYTKQFPSDAAHNFLASTGGATPACTYAGFLNGNAGTSADKGQAWCSITSTTINPGDTPQLPQNAFSVAQD